MEGKVLDQDRANKDGWTRRMGLETYLVKAAGLKEGLLQSASTRGWGFIMTWAHRISGVAVVGFMFFHIFTLSGLYTPEKFAAKMVFLNNGFFAFLEWILAIPVIFHAFNGGRLILYELFRVRNDEEMRRWVLGLGALYVSSLGLFMVMDNQQVSAGAFWFFVVVVSLIAATVVSRKLWPTRNRTFWKLQRISGAFLLPMVSGHFFFMHLNHQAGHDIDTILARVSHAGIKVTDTVFVSLVFFHAGFGLSTIIGDIVEKEHLKTALRLSVALLMAVFGYAGAKLVISL